MRLMQLANCSLERKGAAEPCYTNADLETFTGTYKFLEKCRRIFEFEKPA